MGTLPIIKELFAPSNSEEVALLLLAVRRGRLWAT
jgi:hypothetical protein